VNAFSPGTKASRLKLPPHNINHLVFFQAELSLDRIKWSSILPCHANHPVQIHAAPIAPAPITAVFHFFPVFFPLLSPRKRALAGGADFYRQVGFLHGVVRLIWFNSVIFEFDFI
jgi:hypothetical protein